jgi:hypothetical protein
VNKSSKKTVLTPGLGHLLTIARASDFGSLLALFFNKEPLGSKGLKNAKSFD